MHTQWHRRASTALDYALENVWQIFFPNKLNANLGSGVRPRSAFPQIIWQHDGNFMLRVGSV